MKKTLQAFSLSLLFLFFVANANAQQTAVITGKVLTAEGKPAEGISVKLKGRKMGDATNKSGVFKISNVPAGNYTIQELRHSWK